MKPVPLSHRALWGFFAAFGVGLFVEITWSLIGFGIAGNLPGRQGEAVGYAAIVVAPMGSFAAFLTAFGVGLVPYGARPWLRWVIVAAVALVLGVLTFAVMAH